MNTQRTTTDRTESIESSEQLLTKLQEQAGAFLLGVSKQKSLLDLQKTMATWAQVYGNSKNLTELEKVCEKAVDSFFRITDLERETMIAMLASIRARSFMDAIENMRTESENVFGAQVIQSNTTESLGEVFAEGYFPKSAPKSPVLLTSDGKPVDRMTEMILTEGFPTGDTWPATRETEYGKMLRQAIPD